MELTCKIILTPRAAPGGPAVIITREPSGLLLAAVACTCPADADCLTHAPTELLGRARAHHEAAAPLFPCRFTMHPPSGEPTRALSPDNVLRQPIPAVVPYPPTPVPGPTAADPAHVKAEPALVRYMPPCSSQGGQIGFNKGFRVEYSFTKRR
ncbi:hypothetical protein AURDEDRAFT_113618, partial [Auricularia subglabra TFB-10046 SS5]